MIEVLTHNGFKKFEAILDQGVAKEILYVEFDNGEYIKCTPDHEFLCEDGFTYLPCSFLDVGDILFGNIKIVDIKKDKSERVYDLLEVEDTHAYYTNSVISHNCIFLDEFAFVHKANEFYTSTYPVISSGKDTKVIITSTPNGVGNMFYNLWRGAITSSNEFKPFSIQWQDVPGRDEAWKAQTIANTSEQQFAQEYSCDFLGSADTLISASILLGLQATNPLHIQYDIKYYEEPKIGHEYILVADVSSGLGQDYSTFSVIDISSRPFKQVCTYRNNMISPLLYGNIIVRAATIYNKALAIIENNNSGIVVCNSIYYDHEYDNTFVSSSVKSNGIGVNMTSRVKRIGCANLKDIIEGKKLEIVDPDTIMELGYFQPRGDSYAAADGNHDDMVMPLVLFAWFVSTDLFKEISNTDLKELLYQEKIREMQEDLPPFGFIDDGRSSINNEYNELVNNMNEWRNL
jgi:hypothetical protein